ncbi:plastocyanin/azurin family copper-binding protein [Haloarchaeobius sp. HME9146]|uniref:plastocyanin/azurin family copper-binding protein n=1 Tax=Haloarchaeobius sp. HME9146 TaxID=2978732 RepID=UPI0021C198E5|nr:plastocyanin/azurin family copper-binding protein [Haloarchaeobius sp. HME9146]MCT9096156.1 plastocyanin/azurin family copper-binding protein [Haloarchaeobius sp. HME9146]
MSRDTEDAPISRRQFLTGAAGAAAVAATADTASAQETKTVKVGPGGNYVYTPGTEDPLYVAAGGTVEFVWESDNHNVNPTSVPEGASWEGHKPIENTGFSFTSTFDTKGTYEYQCDPHAGLGMKGEIVVNDSGQAPSSGGGGGGPALPDSAKAIGVATLGAMLSVLSLAFVFLKYGGDYETPE